MHTKLTEITQLNIAPLGFQLKQLYELIKNPDADFEYLQAPPIISLPMAILRKAKNFPKNTVIFDGQNSIKQEQLETQFVLDILNRIGNIAGIKDLIFYPVGEFVANIVEHSKSKAGYLLADISSDHAYLNICITDTGRGFSATYRDEQSMNFSDADALKEVLRGHSTKSSIERGYGIRTSKKLIVEGLTGEFVIISGRDALVSSQKEEALLSLDGFYWQGVIVAYRLPLPIKQIHITEYLE